MAYESLSWVKTLRLRLAVAAAALLLGGAGGSGLRAADPPPPPAPPRIHALFPSGGQRGSTVSATLHGEGLKGLSGFYTTGTGLTARVLPGGDDKTCTVEVTVAPDAPLGIQQIRFHDPANLSNPRFFRVGQWAEVLEKEPNDEVAKAMKITLPATVNGRITENPDRDGFTFHARAGETVVCEIEGIRVLGQIGDSWLKGYLEVTDARGKVLAVSGGTTDDYYRWDPLIAFTPPAEGDYTVWFRDLNWRGDIRSVYRLTVGVVPHAVGIFPLGGKRGTQVPVTFEGPNCPAAPMPVAVPMEPPPGVSDTMPVTLAAPGGATNARPFQMDDLPEILKADAGAASLEKAQVVPFPCVVNGRLAPDRPQDFYRFRLETKQNVVMEVFSRRLGTPMDAEMTLYNGTGSAMQGDDDGRGGDCWISRELTPGEYVVAVRDLQDRSGPAYAYRLSLAPPRPTLAVLVTPDAPRLVRGKPTTLKVKVTREYGWDEDVTISLETPPTGITAAPVTIAKGKTEGDLVITTEPGAALGATRLSFVGTATAGGRALRSPSRTTETYNIQGTAFQRDLIGPIGFVTE